MPQLLHHHLISHHLHYTEINEVYISIAARVFGMSLIGIFVPIYLYNLGYGLAAIALFFIIMQTSRLLTTPFAGFLLARFGAKHLIAISQLLAIVFISLLAVANLNIGMLLLTAAVWGVGIGIFWLAYHFNFSSVRTSKKTSRQVGVMFMLMSIAHALGPLLGGVIATQAGIQYSFLLAIIFLLFSAFAVMQTPESSPKANLGWQDIRNGWKQMQNAAVANGANGFQAEIALSAWPFFIFLFLGTYQVVGFVVSLSLVVSVIAIYFIGNSGDRGKNRQHIHFGSRGSSLVHLSRPFAQTFGTVTGVNVAGDVLSNFYKIPFLSYYYQHVSEAPNPLAYIVRMELANNLGSIIAWSMLLLLAVLLPAQLALTGAFLLAAVAVLFNTRIAPSKITHQDMQASRESA